MDSSTLSQVDKLLHEISSSREQLGSSPLGARETIIDKARQLISTLETPSEAVLWMIWAEPTRTIASRLALDLKIFETLVADNGRPKTATELAAVTGASPSLANRIARKLATMYMVDEIAPEKYAPNSLTRTLSQPKYSSGIRFCHDVPGPAFLHMPEYLKKTNYKTPDNPADGPFQFATKSPNPFVFMNENPELLQAFHGYVHSQTEDRPAWWEQDFYPVEDRVVKGLTSESSSDSSAFIDLGGSVGQVLEGFHAAVPSYNGRLILQELPSVAEVAKSMGLHERGVEVTTHDFFTPQPVKGARVYHMRFILHDWSDDFCLTILGHIKEAMTPGYSKLLINEFVMADQGANWQPVSIDIFMMALGASYERTEDEWKALIAKAGMKIEGIWTKGIGNESLIEVMV